MSPFPYSIPKNVVVCARRHALCKGLVMGGPRVRVVCVVLRFPRVCERVCVCVCVCVRGRQDGSLEEITGHTNAAASFPSYHVPLTPRLHNAPWSTPHALASYALASNTVFHLVPAMCRWERTELAGGFGL